MSRRALAMVVPGAQGLGQPVPSQSATLACIDELALRDLTAPVNLNSGDLEDIYKLRRIVEFEEPQTLEVSYSDGQGRVVREVVFVEPVYSDRRPRMFVSVDGVQAMHSAVFVLSRKVDNLIETLKCCRASYYKELAGLREQLRQQEMANQVGKEYKVRETTVFEAEQFDTRSEADVQRLVRETTVELTRKLTASSDEVRRLTKQVWLQERELGGCGGKGKRGWDAREMVSQLLDALNLDTLLRTVKQAVPENDQNTFWWAVYLLVEENTGINIREVEREIAEERDRKQHLELELAKAVDAKKLESELAQLRQLYQADREKYAEFEAEHAVVVQELKTTRCQVAEFTERCASLEGDRVEFQRLLEDTHNKFAEQLAAEKEQMIRMNTSLQEITAAKGVAKAPRHSVTETTEETLGDVSNKNPDERCSITLDLVAGLDPATQATLLCRILLGVGETVCVAVADELGRLDVEQLPSRARVAAMCALVQGVVEEDVTPFLAVLPSFAKRLVAIEALLTGDEDSSPDKKNNGSKSPPLSYFDCYRDLNRKTRQALTVRLTKTLKGDEVKALADNLGEKARKAMLHSIFEDQDPKDLTKCASMLIADVSLQAVANGCGESAGERLAGMLLQRLDAEAQKRAISVGGTTPAGVGHNRGGAIAAVKVLAGAAARASSGGVGGSEVGDKGVQTDIAGIGTQLNHLRRQKGAAKVRASEVADAGQKDAASPTADGSCATECLACAPAPTQRRRMEVCPMEEETRNRPFAVDALKAALSVDPPDWEAVRNAVAMAQGLGLMRVDYDMSATGEDGSATNCSTRRESFELEPAQQDTRAPAGGEAHGELEGRGAPTSMAQEVAPEGSEVRAEEPTNPVPPPGACSTTGEASAATAAQEGSSQEQPPSERETLPTPAPEAPGPPARSDQPGTREAPGPPTRTDEPTAREASPATLDTSRSIRESRHLGIGQSTRPDVNTSDNGAQTVVGVCATEGNLTKQVVIDNVHPKLSEGIQKEFTAMVVQFFMTVSPSSAQRYLGMLDRATRKQSQAQLGASTENRVATEGTTECAIAELGAAGDADMDCSMTKSEESLQGSSAGAAGGTVEVRPMLLVEPPRLRQDRFHISGVFQQTDASAGVVEVKSNQRAPLPSSGRQALPGAFAVSSGMDQFAAPEKANGLADQAVTRSPFGGPPAQNPGDLGPKSHANQLQAPDNDTPSAIRTQRTGSSHPATPRRQLSPREPSETGEPVDRTFDVEGSIAAGVAASLAKSMGPAGKFSDAVRMTGTLNARRISSTGQVQDSSDDEACQTAVAARNLRMSLANALDCTPRPTADVVGVLGGVCGDNNERTSHSDSSRSSSRAAAKPRANSKQSLKLSLLTRTAVASSLRTSSPAPDKGSKSSSRHASKDGKDGRTSKEGRGQTQGTPREHSEGIAPGQEGGNGVGTPVPPPKAPTTPRPPASTRSLNSRLGGAMQMAQTSKLRPLKGLPSTAAAGSPERPKPAALDEADPASTQALATMAALQENSETQGGKKGALMRSKDPTPRNMFSKVVTTSLALSNRQKMYPKAAASTGDVHEAAAGTGDASGGGMTENGPTPETYRKFEDKSSAVSLPTLPATPLGNTTQQHTDAGMKSMNVLAHVKKSVHRIQHRSQHAPSQEPMSSGPRFQSEGGIKAKQPTAAPPGPCLELDVGRSPVGRSAAPFSMQSPHGEGHQGAQGMPNTPSIRGRMRAAFTRSRPEETTRAADAAGASTELQLPRLAGLATQAFAHRSASPSPGNAPPQKISMGARESAAGRGRTLQTHAERMQPGSQSARGPGTRTPRSERQLQQNEPTQVARLPGDGAISPDVAFASPLARRGVSLTPPRPERALERSASRELLVQPPNSTQKRSPSPCEGRLDAIQDGAELSVAGRSPAPRRPQHSSPQEDAPQQSPKATATRSSPPEETARATPAPLAAPRTPAQSSTAGAEPAASPSPVPELATPRPWAASRPPSQLSTATESATSPSQPAERATPGPSVASRPPAQSPPQERLPRRGKGQSSPQERLPSRGKGQSPPQERLPSRGKGGVQSAANLVNRVRDQLANTHGSVAAALSALLPAGGFGTGTGSVSLELLQQGLVEAGVAVRDACLLSQALLGTRAAAKDCGRDGSQSLPVSLSELSAALQPGGLPQTAVDMARQSSRGSNRMANRSPLEAGIAVPFI